MIVLKEGHLTDKSNDRVGHLNTVLAQKVGSLRLQSAKVKMPGFFPGRGGGC